MNFCHLVTKGFDNDIVIRRTITYNGVPFTIGAVSKRHEETVEFHKSLPNEINVVQSLDDGRKRVIESPIGDIVSSQGNILPLSSIYDYKVKSDDNISKFIPVGASFDDLFESIQVKDMMASIASTMFPNENPNTYSSDISESVFYTPYIPLVALTGCIPPQIQDGQDYFNPDGTITIAEFLDSLNSIKYSCNSNQSRKKTLDNISNESDYFNEGYQSCLRGISSPFFNLYTREELLKPITRLELAYITVICWTQFIEKFNNLYGGNFYLGITFDWEVPSDKLFDYADGFDYKVSRISIDDEHDVVSLDLKDYKSDRTMKEYLEDIKTGRSPIALPAFMSMIEIGVLDLFHYMENRLDPLKEVSRGELAYFLARLSKLFPIRYHKQKEDVKNE